MKSYPVALSFYSAAWCLVLAACSSNKGPLFEDVDAPPDITPEANAPGPPGMQMPSDQEMMPPDDGVEPGMMPPGEAPEDDDLPLDTDNPIEDDDDEPVDPPEDPPAEPQPTIPTVIEVFPENQATAVDGDTSIIITFSEPMNQAATEAAYQSEGIPSSGVSFSWNDEGTELTVTPNTPLEYDSGPDPESVEARRYSFFISSLAEDLEGDRLANAADFSFSVLRQIEATFPAVQDRDLTGHFRSDGTYAATNAECARATSNVCVGDAGDNDRYQGFVTFDLSALPETMTRVSAATLSLQITSGAGNPFGNLQRLMLDHIAFDAIGAGAFTGQPLAVVGPVATAGTVGTVLTDDVLAAVVSDVAEGTLTQYRLRFERGSDNDEAQDIIRSNWDTQTLAVTYLIP